MLVLVFLIAFAAALLLHPKIVEVAKMKGITDNPGYRKLQREPVPVLGGVVVFFGILTALGLTTWMVSYHDFLLYISLMLVMLVTGTLDDISSLSPRLRFLIEIAVAIMLMWLGNLWINDFHGLWGVGEISVWIAIPLTIITVVGIVNAINLIDGVDGLSSGYCIMACLMFGWFFWICGDEAMTALSFACIGALIPFFVYNVFGKRRKMFIGDGGSLLMGIILSIMALRIITAGSPIGLLASDESQLFFPYGKTHFGFVPFTLAILSFPICDTLRVMISRILRHVSPFSPDKTHLHHAFISVGFSHIKTTISVLALNAIVFVLWNMLWRLGCSVECQFYAVVGTTIALNLLLYYICHRTGRLKNT